MAKMELPYGKTSNAQRKLFIVLSEISKNRILFLFSILDFQFVLPQYLLICISLNENSSLLCSGNPKIVIYRYTPGEEGVESEWVVAVRIKVREIE